MRQSDKPKLATVLAIRADMVEQRGEPKAFERYSSPEDFLQSLMKKQQLVAQLTYLKGKGPKGSA